MQNDQGNNGVFPDSETPADVEPTDTGSAAAPVESPAAETVPVEVVSAETPSKDTLPGESADERSLGASSAAMPSDETSADGHALDAPVAEGVSSGPLLSVQLPAVPSLRVQSYDSSLTDAGMIVSADFRDPASIDGSGDFGDGSSDTSAAGVEGDDPSERREPDQSDFARNENEAAASRYPYDSYAYAGDDRADGVAGDADIDGAGGGDGFVPDPSAIDDAESAARDARTFQVADHGVDVSPVPPAVPPHAAYAAEPSAESAGHADGTGRRQPDGSTTATDAAAVAETKSNDRFTFRDFLLWCGVPVLIVLLIRILLVGFYEIPSRSMMDTVVPGDRVVASKLTPKVFDLKRGDVVVFKDPNNWLSEEQSSGFGGGYLIKRLIGLPGDVVECKGAGQPVTINGVAINESSYIRPGVEPSAFPFSVTVTEGHIFVMGDNRANSADSRYHQDDADRGLVPISDVVGVGFVRYWPLDRISLIDSHHEVFDAVPEGTASGE